MAIIKLVCEQCGGSIALDNSHEIGTCEHCFAQFVVRQDQIVQKITQNITKHVYGYEGKDVAELLNEGYKMKDLGAVEQANRKFKRAIDIEPDCWSAWLGYASTGGDRTEYLSAVTAHIHAYNIASTEQEQAETYVSLTDYIPDGHLRAAFIRAFNTASRSERQRIFELVSHVVGCDESEIAHLAVDLCPEDWRAHFAMAKFRQIRARWCEPEGFRKRLPLPAQEVADLFMRTYRLAKREGIDARQTIVSYIDTMAADKTYRTLSSYLIKTIRAEG